MRLSLAERRAILRAISAGPQVRGLGVFSEALDLHLRSRYQHWWRDDQVVGLAFVRVRGPGETFEHVLEIWRVGERIASESLDLGGMGQVSTVVVTVGEPKLDMLVSIDRPLHGGYNTGDGDGIESGTFGCVVRSLKTNELLGLTCGHVLEPFADLPPPKTVLAPSYDNAKDHPGWLEKAPIGTVAAWSTIDFAADAGERNVDGAVFQPFDPGLLDAMIADVNLVPSGIAEPPEDQDPVQKVGYATEKTIGTVHGQPCTVRIPYKLSNGTVKQAIFSDQIAVVPIPGSGYARKGDSGALVMDLKGSAIGVHTVNVDSRFICQPIQRVLSALECELVTNVPFRTAAAKAVVRAWKWLASAVHGASFSRRRVRVPNFALLGPTRPTASRPRSLARSRLRRTSQHA